MLYGTLIAATVLLLSFVTLRRLLAPVALLTAVTRRIAAGEDGRERARGRTPGRYRRARARHPVAGA
ncbi:MAG: hypothetical protein WDO24_06590 [Pseudomonadota bacterium]